MHRRWRSRRFSSPQWSCPGGITVLPDGSLVLADASSLRELSADGSPRRVLSIGPTYLYQTSTVLASNSRGEAFVALGTHIGGDWGLPDTAMFSLNRIAADGSLVPLLDQSSAAHPALRAAIGKVLWPQGLTSADDGRLMFSFGHAVFVLTSDGKVEILAGSFDAAGSADGAAAMARFSSPSGLALDRAGNLYVADTGNHTVRKITPNGSVSTLLGRAGQAGIVLGPAPAGLVAPRSVTVVPGGLVIASRLAVLLASP